jgi:hypothetical protein
METPARYRELAAECLRLVSIARTDEHRKILLAMARAWQDVAEQCERSSAELSMPYVQV